MPRHVGPCDRDDGTVRFESQPRFAEVLERQGADQVQCAILRVDARPRRTQLDRRDDAAFDEFPVAVQRYGQDRCNALDACDADAVVRGEIAEAVRDQAIPVALHCAHDVRAVADDEIGARVDHASCEPDDVAARLAVVLLLGEWHVRRTGALGPAVERDDDDVEGVVERGDPRERPVVVEQHVGVLRHGVVEEHDGHVAVRYRRPAALAAGAQDASGAQRFCARIASFFAEVACVVVREAQHVESCVAIVLRVARRRSEQVAGVGIAALLGGFAAVDEHALEIAERDIGGRQYRRNAGKEARAVVVGQVIAGVVRADHHVADGRDADAHLRPVDGRRRGGSIGRGSGFSRDRA